MQISGTTSSASIPLQRASVPSSAVQSTSDQAVLNTSADSFSSLVKAASQMPEVRVDLVATYKARVQAGHYPEQDIIAGGGIMQQAKAGSTSQSS
jgi:hypothetical protein